MLEFAYSSPSLTPYHADFSDNFDEPRAYSSDNLLNQFIAARANEPPPETGRTASDHGAVDAPSIANRHAEKYAEYDQLRHPFNERLKARWQQHVAVMEHFIRYRRSAAFGTRGSPEDIAFFKDQEIQIEKTRQKQLLGLQAARRQATRLLSGPNNREVKVDFKTYTDAMHDMMAIEVQAIEKCLALVQVLLVAWSRPGRDGKLLHTHALRLSDLVDDLITEEDITNVFNDGDGDEVSFEEALEESLTEYRMVRAELAK